MQTSDVSSPRQDVLYDNTQILGSKRKYYVDLYSNQAFYDYQERGFGNISGSIGNSLSGVASLFESLINHVAVALASGDADRAGLVVRIYLETYMLTRTTEKPEIHMIAIPTLLDGVIRQFKRGQEESGRAIAGAQEATRGGVLGGLNPSN